MSKETPTELKEKIWGILLERGCGIITPNYLAEILEEKGIDCSREEMFGALSALEAEQGLFYGTLWSIWWKK